ncbi:sugar ABC transporter permease [Streptomyces sp. NPDC059989]|uniref:sugar ABC transporter permease n=1 Tax=Streptomyces sp. NPDC059989 TaxID=3347026 RepID=UPI0036BBC470
MRTEEWAGRALAAVLERVAVTRAEVGARFPLYADPGDGRWTTTGRGSWTGGFWAGLLWLRARYTGAEADRRAAAARTARLAPWADADTATRGLILWYGTVLAGDDPDAAALRERAARACLAAHDPELGLVPWGAALGGPRLLARVDAVPGMVPLLAGAGPEGAAVAAAHLHRHLDLCLDGRPARPAWRFAEDTGWQPCEDPPAGWTRGRAWLLLALADALLLPEVAAHRPGRLAEAEERLLSYGEFLAGRRVPPADSTRPDGPLDTSAAAITAVALLKLARVPGPRAARCSYRAVAVLERLTEAHLSGGGMLLDGCYDAGRGLATRHELVWGDFFLALGLAALTGLVDVTRV